MSTRLKILLLALLLPLVLAATYAAKRPRVTVRALGLSFDPARPGLRIEVHQRGQGELELIDPNCRVAGDPSDTLSCHIWVLDWEGLYGTEATIQLVIPPRELAGKDRLGLLYRSYPPAYLEDLWYWLEMEEPDQRFAWVQDFTPPSAEDLAKLEGLAAQLAKGQ